MWVIQKQSLLRIPDDAPLPPDSVKVDVPDDLLRQPHAYRIQGSRVLKRSAAEIKKLQSPRPPLQLTQAEIARLKKAIAAGKI